MQQEDSHEKMLIKLLAEGNHDAFQCVFNTYYTKVFRFIAGLIKSEDDAKDLTQDVFVKLWSIHETLKDLGSLSNFLFTLSRNAALNFIKSQSKHSDKLEALIEKETVHTYSLNPEEEIELKDLSLLIDIAINRMPSQRKSIFLLSRKAGLSSDQIAQKMNLSRRTVENHIYAALKELKKVIHR